jgi:hypothetical protein
MHNSLKKTLGLVFALSTFGCGDIDVPDLNNPSVDALEKTPTRSAVMAASTGLIIGSRAGMALTNGYVSQLGVLGREVYNLDTADPAYVGQLLASQGLDPGSPAFGGNFWAAPYRNLKNARTVLSALDNASLKGVSAEEKEAIRGFTNTMSALDYLQLINTRDSAGAADAHAEPDARGFYPLVDKAAIFTRIVQLLDEADVQLAAGGAAFPFPMGDGFDGFDTPATFRKFNRALRARVAAYRQDWDTVLSLTSGSATFIDTSFAPGEANAAANAEKMKAGVYFTYSTDSNDTTNALNAPVLYVHPSVFSQAERNAESNAEDARVSSSTKAADKANTYRGLTGTHRFTKYGPTSPLPIIRNEELILLRAEAYIGKGNLAAAEAELDRVRVFSGQLRPMAQSGLTLTAANAVDHLLKQRRYSLLFEGGHSWIDARRYGRLSSLPLDGTAEVPHYHVTHYPIPTAEMDGRK